MKPGRFLLPLLIAGSVAAQGLDAAKLLQPATDTWPTFHGDYSGRRHSALSQVIAANIGTLCLAWVFRANQGAIKSTPLEVNGILYFTVPDHVWAVDARTGRQLWHYIWNHVLVGVSGDSMDVPGFLKPAIRRQVIRRLEI